MKHEASATFAPLDGRPAAELEARLTEVARLIGAADPHARRKFATEKRELEAHLKARLEPIDRVRLARNPARPQTLDYVEALVADFMEIHGDRRFADDGAIVAGLGYLGRVPVAIAGHQRGRSTAERIRRNFGKPYPEGYRKAARVFDLARRFALPLITFIDTQGAEPGVGAEERGQSEAIAANLELMAKIEAPVIACVIGEGGSGGALGIGVADRVLILESAYYSVISPEACSAILWRDRRHAAEAAEALKLTAQDLLKLEVVDEIVPEPEGGAHRDYDSVAENLGSALRGNLQHISKTPIDELVEKRYEKFRRLGLFTQGKTATASAPS
jgi:acetyl-CoA carboxylase carboxyl transferase subunit alpha